MLWCGAVVGRGGGGLLAAAMMTAASTPQPQAKSCSCLPNKHASWYHVQLTLILMLLMSQSFWWSFQDTCCLAFHTSTMQKPRIFCNFPDKNFENDAKIELKKSTKSMVFATLSQKRYQKTRTKNIGKRKHRHIVLLTKTSQNTGFS